MGRLADILAGVLIALFIAAMVTLTIITLSGTTWIP